MKPNSFVTTACLFTLCHVCLVVENSQAQVIPSERSSLSATSPAQGSLRPPSPDLVANYSKLPLSFEANQGQTDARVKFLSRGSGFSLFLTDREAVLKVSKEIEGKYNSDRAGNTRGKSFFTRAGEINDVLRLELVGARSSRNIEGDDRLASTTNYFLGSDPAAWHRNIPNYARVRYPDVYPGIDLAYYGNQGQLEYDFVVAPGADPKPVKLRFAGSRKLALDNHGNLVVSAKNGQISFLKPVVYQGEGTTRKTVDGSFTLLAGNTVGFRLGNYDPRRTLIIDPALAYSTYLGGTGSDTAVGIAVDSAGDAYVTGKAGSIDFPVTLPHPTRSTDPFGMPYLAKLNPAGSALVYSTFFGGSGSFEGGDYVGGVAVDSSGAAYVTGTTYSTDFPITPAAFQARNYGINAFVTKFSPDGATLEYSTYLGGSGGSGGGDGANAIALDHWGAAYVVGYTYSHDFPVSNVAIQRMNLTPQSYTPTAFISKVSSTGTTLDYSSYLGGTGSDMATAIAVSGAGNAIVTGTAGSTDFPVTPGALQTTRGTGLGNVAFVSRINTQGSGLVYSTYLGGSVSDRPFGVAIDEAGATYVAGETLSGDFPTTLNAFQRTKNRNESGFISKLNQTGTALVYSTFLGGVSPADSDAVIGIALDTLGHAYVTGYTYSPNFPVTASAFQAQNNAAVLGAENAFLTELNTAGSALLYSTLLGGIGHTDPYTGFVGDGDRGEAIAVDQLGNAYIAGIAHSADFPLTKGAFQIRNNSVAKQSSLQENAFLAKFALAGVTSTHISAAGTPQTGSPVTFHAVVTPLKTTNKASGEVHFLVDGVTQSIISLQDADDAFYSTQSLSLGQHAIVASYFGEPGIYSSSGDSMTVTISPPASSKGTSAVVPSHP